jgi:hypothetical protein
MQSPLFGFEEALHNLKQGRAMARRGWNGRRIPGLTRDMFVQVVEGNVVAGTGGASVDVLSCLAMHTIEGKWQLGWVPSTADLFATDWEVVTPGVAAPTEANENG